MLMSSFARVDLGTIDWHEALQAQLTYAQRAQQGERFLLFAEHPPVLTLGRNANPSNIKISPAAATQRGIALHHCERGGDVTAHLLGQVVLYPILRLANPLGVRAYIRVLEQTVIAVLQHYGITACVRQGLPGVWVNMEKIAFIGIRIKNRVTQHGLALNVNNDLELFELIVPCGLSDITVTSMRQLLGQKVALARIKDDLHSCFEAALVESDARVVK